MSSLRFDVTSSPPLRLHVNRGIVRHGTYGSPPARVPEVPVKLTQPARSPADLQVEGPIRRTREGGSEWEPIKILLEVDGNSYNMNTASNTRLRLTTQVDQAHVATEVPLDLGTNTHTLPTRERSGTPNLESTD
jgi:hypothetical protein